MFKILSLALLLLTACATRASQETTTPEPPMLTVDDLTVENYRNVFGIKPFDMAVCGPIDAKLGQVCQSKIEYSPQMVPLKAQWTQLNEDGRTVFVSQTPNARVTMSDLGMQWDLEVLFRPRPTNE